MDGSLIFGLGLSLAAITFLVWYAFFGGANFHAKLLKRTLNFMVDISFVKKDRRQKSADRIDDYVLFAITAGKIFSVMMIILILIGWVFMLTD